MQRANFPWKDTILPLRYISEFTTLAGYIEVSHSPTFYMSLVFMAGAWTSVFLGISLWAIFEFSHARIPPIAALRVLRTVATFSASVRASKHLSSSRTYTSYLPSVLMCSADRLYSHLRGSFDDTQLQVSFGGCHSILTSVNNVCSLRCMCSDKKHFVPDIYWMKFNYVCFTGSHAALVIIGISLAIFFAVFGT